MTTTNSAATEQTKYIDVTTEEKKLFPEHLGEKLKESKDSIFRRPQFLQSNPDDDKIKCEKNVINCLEKYPIAKIMLNALSKAGCNVNLKRHFSCEYCSDKVTNSVNLLPD